MRDRIDRRALLQLLSFGGAHALLPGLTGCSSTEPVPPLGEPLFLGGVTTSLPQDQAYTAVIEGSLPADLQGVLYRNGPGLFERGDVRKACLVDGDGMLNVYDFRDGGVHFRSRMTQTRKFLQEEQAGKYLFDSWTTKTPGTGDFPAIENQAGVSVRRFRDRLYLFDEGSQPYEIDLETFDTLEESDLGFGSDVVFAAHPKKLASTGEWVHFGLGYGPVGTLHLGVLAADGSVVEQRQLTLDPIRYVHDFFATESHLLVHVHPAELDLGTLLGGGTVHGSLNWKATQGSQLLLMERGVDAPPQELMIDARWMWHSVNCHAAAGELVLDWIGYDTPEHFLGEDSELCAVMRGIESPANDRGHLRRTRIDLASAKVVSDERVDGLVHSELPSLNPHRLGLAARYAYVAHNPHDTVLMNAVARIDMTTGAHQSYDFGVGTLCGEPVFVPIPGQSYDGTSAAEPGYVLAEITEASSARGALAVFDAEHISDGPLALARLEHHIPLKFHGEWAPV